MQNSRSEIGVFFPLIFCEDGGGREEARRLAWLTEVINSHKSKSWRASALSNMKTGIIYSCMRRAIPSLTLCTWLTIFRSWLSCTPAALLGPFQWLHADGGGLLHPEQSSGRSHRQICTPQPDSSHAECPWLKPSLFLAAVPVYAVELPGFSKGTCSCSKCLGGSQQQTGTSANSGLEQLQGNPLPKLRFWAVENLCSRVRK